jgi:hypothetical protein
MSLIFIVVLRTQKRLMPKDVAAVKGLISSYSVYHLRVYTCLIVANLLPGEITVCSETQVVISSAL